MSSKSNIFLSCEEANHTCDKTQYNDATLWEKIKLNLHLLGCKVCRQYTKNNAKLTKLMKGKQVKAMTTSDKNSLHKAFEKELQNHR